MTNDSAMFRATYRLQLRKTFPFKAAQQILPYLNDLGISHLYLSPILESAKESNHGYDAIDPTKISVERGGETGFNQLMEKLARQKNLKGAILDIVPNHVAASLSNPAWLNVLKLGPKSEYYRFFDFRPRANGDKRIVLPVLGKKLRAVLAAKELKLARVGGELVFRYFDKDFPINPAGVSGELAKLSDSELADVSIRAIEDLMKQQAYALEDWKSGSREINYRRFFDINDLAAIRIEDPVVFDWDHSKIKQLVENNPLIHGLRVDHVDGLTDPESYLKRLQGISKNIWVEKILGDGETMPSTWPIQGTTGYEFSNASSRVFVDLPGLQHLHAHYTRSVDRRWERFQECVYDSKREMLESHFVSEINFITDEFHRLAKADRAKAGSSTDFSKDELQLALIELTASLHVYRTYAKKGEAIQSRFLNEALAEVEGRGRITTTAAFNWLRATLLAPGDWSDEILQIIKRWEQLSGPVMAKGLEDTALYRYFPHLSLNGVGGEPDWKGDGAIEFHAANREKVRSSPFTLNASSTHDTKRSEDVRSRLHVVSELAEEWTRLVDHLVDEKSAVDKSTQYLIFETIVGAWPLDGRISKEFVERLNQYFTKAMREAKSATSWNDPDEKYEALVLNFVGTLLKANTPKGKKNFERLESFAEKCAYFGAWNSLSFLGIKALSPGLPDFYQGCEMWDLSLVDPDNRRPVDYEHRISSLKAIRAERVEPKKLKKRTLAKWRTGEIKLWMTYELLQIRLKNPELFTMGEYFALDPIGEGRRHVLGFLRHFEGQWALVVVPRFLASALGQTSRAKTDWTKTPLTFDPLAVPVASFDLPVHAPEEWENPITATRLKGKSFTTEECLDGLPVGVWTARARD